MPGRESKVFAIMFYLGNSRRIVSNTTLAIPLHRVWGPGTIPETVDDIHVLISDLVALVMRYEFFSKSIRCGFRPTCDNVPCNSTIGKMV